MLVLVFVCRSHQRPQLELGTATETSAADTAAATEETTVKSSQDEAAARVTEAAAVSVETSVNVSSYVPSEVYEDFKPSNYYRPDGNPIFERPSQQVQTHALFYGPQHFQRPAAGLVHPSSATTATPQDKYPVIFPQASHEHVVQQQHSNRSNGPESRSPYQFTEAQHKPMKHDYGETVPKFSEYDNSFYEKYFGKYYGNVANDMPPHYHQPDFEREPPRSYHSVATRKK